MSSFPPYGMCEFRNCIEPANKGSRYCDGFHKKPDCSVAGCKKPRTPYRALCRKHLTQYENWSQCRRPISVWLEKRQLSIDKKRAEDPDTKPLLLLHLADSHPKAVWQNPGLKLLKVGDPSLYVQIVCRAKLEMARSHCEEAASPYSKEDLIPWVCDCIQKLRSTCELALVETALEVARKPASFGKQKIKSLIRALKQQKKAAACEEEMVLFGTLFHLLSPDDWFGSPIEDCFELARVLTSAREHKEGHKSFEERLWPEIAWQVDRLYFHLRKLERGVA